MLFSHVSFSEMRVCHSMTPDKLANPVVPDHTFSQVTDERAVTTDTV
jgi:hypothetical protein